MRAFLIAAFALAACAQTQAPPPPAANLPQHILEDLAQREAALREPGVVAAAIGQTADLGGGLRVRPLEVLEDSRCPQNARCVWAGRVRLRVSIEGAGEREISSEEEAVQTPHGAFTLAAILPGPWTDWPADQRPPYRFGFKRT